MKITKTELAKIVKEETEAYLGEREIDLEPESWYADESPGDLPPLQPGGEMQKKLQKTMENMVHLLSKPPFSDVAAFAENQLPDVKARGEQLLPLVTALKKKLQEEGFAPGER